MRWETWPAWHPFANSEGFDRLALTAQQWGKAPSDYVRGLPALHRYWLDEAAWVWLAETLEKQNPDIGAQQPRQYWTPQELKALAGRR